MNCSGSCVAACGGGICCAHAVACACGDATLSELISVLRVEAAKTWKWCFCKDRCCLQDL